MSTLRSALDELRAEDLRYACEEGLETDLTELERAAGALEAELARPGGRDRPAGIVPA